MPDWTGAPSSPRAAMADLMGQAVVALEDENDPAKTAQLLRQAADAIDVLPPDDRFRVDHWKLRAAERVLARRYSTADEALDIVLRGLERRVTLVAYNRFGKVMAEFTRVLPEAVDDDR